MTVGSPGSEVFGCWIRSRIDRRLRGALRRRSAGDPIQCGRGVRGKLDVRVGTFLDMSEPAIRGDAVEPGAAHHGRRGRGAPANIGGQRPAGDRARLPVEHLDPANRVSYQQLDGAVRLRTPVARLAFARPGD